MSDFLLKSLANQEVSIICLDPTLIRLLAHHRIDERHDAMQELRDDGVKVNYQKFGPALKKIPGLDAKEE